MQRIELNYSAETGLTVSVISPYADSDKDILEHFWAELAAKPEVLKRIYGRGTTDKVSLLKEYLICFYGGNDNKADSVEGKTTSDYCHCGRRGFCPDEGFKGLCSVAAINNVRLSRSEVNAIQYSNMDFSVKEIAEKLHRSVHTIESHFRNFRQKVGCRSMAGAISKAAVAGIIKTSAE